jgi:hypothetical protein
VTIGRSVCLCVLLSGVQNYEGCGMDRRQEGNPRQHGDDDDARVFHAMRTPTTTEVGRRFMIDLQLSYC